MLEQNGHERNQGPKQKTVSATGTPTAATGSAAGRNLSQIWSDCQSAESCSQEQKLGTSSSVAGGNSMQLLTEDRVDPVLPHEVSKHLKQQFNYPVKNALSCIFAGD